MIRNAALHWKQEHARGSIVWGYRDVAVLATCTVRRWRDDDTKPWRWALEATLSSAVDAFAMRQRPLLFIAPRQKAGHFCWPVRELTIAAEGRRLTATLGPPEY